MYLLDTCAFIWALIETAYMERIKTLPLIHKEDQ